MIQIMAIETSKTLPKLSGWASMVSGLDTDLGLNLEERLKLIGNAVDNLMKAGELKLNPSLQQMGMDESIL